jgi:hypothetical protein
MELLLGTKNEGKHKKENNSTKTVGKTKQKEEKKERNDSRRNSKE